MWRRAVLLNMVLAAVRTAALRLAGRQALAVPRLPHAARRCAALHMGETIIVTDGTDSFYGSRTVFQALHDFGNFDKIISWGSSVADSKKMLLSRQARYSGLIDVLEFTEGEFGEAAAAATCWLTVNADEVQLTSQLAAAQAAGIKRVFALVTADGPTTSLGDAAALKSTLAGAGMTYSVMRTGSLVATGNGGGLRLGEVDEPTCDDVPKDDIFRFVCEALTIPEAYDRMFSLCPSADDSQFKEMRMAGCNRREEAEALLKGQIKERDLEAEAQAEEEVKEEDSKSSAETEAEREEELKMLLERARTRGIENQKKMAEEEAVKQAARAERQAYFAQLAESSEEEKKDDDDEGDDKPDDDSPPPSSPDDKKDGGDGGDGGKSGGDEPPLALA